MTFFTPQTKHWVSQIEYQAGIKFETIHPPTQEEVLKKSGLTMLKQLNVVQDNVLPMFEEAAQALLNDCSGDAIKAISKTLAFISGRTSKDSKAKSDNNDTYGGCDPDGDAYGSGRRSFGGGYGGGSSRGRGQRGGGGGSRGGYSGGGGYRQHSSYNDCDDYPAHSGWKPAPQQPGFRGPRPAESSSGSHYSTPSSRGYDHGQRSHESRRYNDLNVY